MCNIYENSHRRIKYQRLKDHAVKPLEQILLLYLHIK
jgi:hypothetical protein